MREYGQVQCSFWGHPDTVDLSDEAKLLALYLLTGPHSNGLGCYRIPDGYIMSDLSWDAERVSKGFAELSQNGFCDRCERSKYVLIYGFLKWNPISNANVAKAREKEYRDVPASFTLLPELINELQKNGKHLSEPFRKGLETVVRRPSETLSKQDPTRPDPTQTLNPPAKEAGKYPSAVGGGKA